MTRKLAITLVSVAVTVLAAQAHAASPQPAEEADTILGRDAKISGYGGPELKATSVLGTTSALVGAQGGALLGHAVVLGGGGYGLASLVEVPNALQSPGASRRLSLGYGGARVAWIVTPRFVVHPVVAMLIGGGALSWEANTGGFEYDDGVAEPDMESRSDAFFVLEPQIEVEANLHRMFRVGVTGSYRWVQGIQAASLGDGDVSGFAFGGVIKFGVF